jgi:hypothetical protein
VKRASSWKRLQGIARRHWGRLTSADLDRTARKVSRAQLVEWLAREHKRDPIHQ